MKKWLILAAVLLIGAATAYLAPLIMPKPSDRLPVGASFPFFWDQGYRFWAGVNYPWKSYQDFGTGAGYSGSATLPYMKRSTPISPTSQHRSAGGWRRVFNDGRYSRISRKMAP